MVIRAKMSRSPVPTKPAIPHIGAVTRPKNEKGKGRCFRSRLPKRLDPFRSDPQNKLRASLMSPMFPRVDPMLFGPAAQRIRWSCASLIACLGIFGAVVLGWALTEPIIFEGAPY